MNTDPQVPRYLRHINTQQFRSLNALSPKEAEKHEKEFMAKYVDILKKNANGAIITLTKVINILKIHQLLRNVKQLEILKVYFELNFPYIGKFKDKLDDNKCLDLFRYMNVEKYKALTTIFRQGEPGRKMYFLLQGEVGIFVPKTKSSQEVQNLICHDFKDVIEIQFCEFTLVAVKHFGQVFGEIAIEQRVTRTATVVAKTEVLVALLSYEMYKDVIGKHQNELTVKKLEFIDSLPLFKNWEEKEKLIALSSFEQQSALAGQTIFQRGPLDENIYLVISGEVEVISWIKIKSNLTLNNIMKQQIMAIINSGQFFGDYEHIKGLHERVTSAKAKMETQYYRIKYTLLLDILDMYSNVENFKQEQLKKFQIQSKLMSKTKELALKTEESDPELKISLDKIKESYYKQLKVEKTINDLKKKIFITEDKHYKEHYKNQIDKLSKTLSIYDTIQSNKYSSFIPNKYDPYMNAQNFVSSPNRSKTNKFLFTNENKQPDQVEYKDKGIEKFMANQQQYHIQQKFKHQNRKQTKSQNVKNESNLSLNSLSLSRIIQDKISKLNLTKSYYNLKKSKSGQTLLDESKSDLLRSQLSVHIRSYRNDNNITSNRSLKSTISRNYYKSREKQFKKIITT